MARTQPDPNARLVAFGARVRQIRRQRELSQEALAHLAGLDRSYVGGIERGERNITLTKFWVLADALGVLPEELL